jgi:hypothetical protein
MGGSLLARGRRLVAGTGMAALTGGVAIAAQLAALVPAQAATPTITIAATSKIKPVTGFVLVVFQDRSVSNAKIHGNITGATTGEVATLYAQRFPYTRPAKPVSSITLSPAGATTPYSFTVTPALATRYKVKLLASSTATTPLATSPKQNVYVTPGGFTKGGGPCGRPVCHQTLRLFTILPASALRFQMSQHLYPYFGLRLGASATPPPPKWLYLNAGHASVSNPRRISASEFEQTLKLSFTIGNHSYYWNSTACWKDSVSKDGLGLPGHHGCGASRILRTFSYLG